MFLENFEQSLVKQLRGESVLDEINKCNILAGFTLLRCTGRFDFYLYFSFWEREEGEMRECFPDFFRSMFVREKNDGNIFKHQEYFHSCNGFEKQCWYEETCLEGKSVAYNDDVPVFNVRAFYHRDDFVDCIKKDIFEPLRKIIAQWGDNDRSE